MPKITRSKRAKGLAVEPDFQAAYQWARAMCISSSALDRGGKVQSKIRLATTPVCQSKSLLAQLLM
jgi:hypothetical protein